MTKLDLKKPYGTIFGHPIAAYEQNGVLFDGAGKPVNMGPKPVFSKNTTFAPGLDDPLAGAKAFLLQILKENPLSKSIVYREAENNNQVWDHVRDAAIALGIVKFTDGPTKLEMWRLPETVGA